MAITLSRTDYDELWQTANPLPLSVNAQGYGELRQVVPQRLGRGYIHRIQLREINLCLFNYQLHDDLCVAVTSQPGRFASSELGFNLSGNRSGKCTGDNFIEWGTCNEPDNRLWITYANDPVLKVDLHLDSVDGLTRLVTDALDELPEGIRHCIEAREGGWFSEINAITPAMRSALEQILYCPFQGKTKQIYLESKCLELIALKLAQLKESELPVKAPVSLSPDDVDRIYAAQKILEENPENPPSLMALARQVSLNDYKLKVGFKAVFGTTVFGYLHRHRMETARELLNSRRLNVKEVAQSVGYANQSRFAVAFRKQFGVNPKAYLLGRQSG